SDLVLPKMRLGARLGSAVAGAASPTSSAGTPTVSINKRSFLCMIPPCAVLRRREYSPCRQVEPAEQALALAGCGDRHVASQDQGIVSPHTTPIALVAGSCHASRSSQRKAPCPGRVCFCASCAVCW